MIIMFFGSGRAVGVRGYMDTGFSGYVYGDLGPVGFLGLIAWRLFVADEQVWRTVVKTDGLG